MASSSSDPASASARQPKHEVFLSFRGEDTRNNFLYHLYEAFRRKGIGAYADFSELPRGEEISQALLQAIEKSMISIIVFSQNYATSSWCLDELSKIMECWNSRGQLVIPIFYHVYPSDVRNQTDSFGEAFVEHERSKKDKVQEWKRALKEAGNLSGFTLTGDTPEPIVIEKIVHDVLNKLNRLSKRDYKGLIGIGSPVEQIKSLLCIGGDQDVRIIGIWGMGGIGKTTLAQVVYDEVSAQFESCYFLANVREQSERHGVIDLRNKLLSKLLNEDNLHICTPLLASTFIKNRLCRKRVLVVLDDVDNVKQLEEFALCHDHFGFGSRIILTSRDRHVLLSGSVDGIYKVEELSCNDSLQLFSLSAFKQNYPVDDFKDLSNSFLEYTKGVPIAIKVLGSTLYQRSRAYWESALNGLKQYPKLKTEIQNVLKISFDGLEEPEKNIFLDIACFFKRYGGYYVAKILEGCYGAIAFSTIINLKDKCLLNVTKDYTLEMHDLLQEMGRNVVLAESTDPEERSRLWTPADIRQVLESGEGTKSIQGMLLDQSQIGEIQLHPGAFARMRRLRIIKFYGKGGKLVPLDPGLESLPNELRCFHWEYCMLKSLPSKFRPEKLVELRLPKSKVEQLWNGKQDLVNLRVLDLNNCKNLTSIPDLSASINIYNFNFLGCESLVELPSMIHMKYLPRDLYIYGCKNLKKFPELPQHIRGLSLSDTMIEEIPGPIELHGNQIEERPWSIGCLNQLDHWIMSGSRIHNPPSVIFQLNALRSIGLDDCPNITEFPNVPANTQMLTLDNTAIEEVPSSISRLKSLAHLSMNGTAIEEVPSSISELISLAYWSLEGCTKLKSLPESICKLKSLAQLHLSRTAIEEVPSSISELESLSHWSMEDCTNLKSLPNSIGKLKSLETLNLDGCSNLEHFPEILQTMGCLFFLHLRRTGKKVLRPWNTFGLGTLVFLKELHLSGSDVVEIPEGIKQHSNLICLYLTCCKSLKSLPQLPPCLRYLIAQGCTSLESFSKFWSKKLGPRFLKRNFESGVRWFETLDENYFMFNNCFNLDRDAVNNIVASTLLKIQRIAEEFPVESIKRIRCNQDQSVFSCFPGSEIPETFENRSTNSSITVQLSPPCSSERFLGFVLCIVVDFKHHQEGNFFVDYEFRCGDHHKVGSNCPWPTEMEKFKGMESNHVIVLFHAFRSGIVETSRDKHFDEVSFDFSVRAFDSEWDIEEQIEVQKCGVNVLYVDVVRSNDEVVESSSNRRSDGVDEGNRCDASMSEPNSALGPNLLPWNCDVNNRDLEGSVMEEDANDEEGLGDDPTTTRRARLKRRFGSDEEEEPDPQRPRYSH